MAKDRIEYPQESYRALAIIPHDTPDGVRALESAHSWWVGQMDSSKWPRALNWFTNFAFLCGNQYPNFTWNGSILRWSGSTFDSNYSGANLIPGSGNLSGMGGGHGQVPKTVDNQLLRPYEANVSLMTEMKPRPRVEPNSDRAEDMEAASLSEVTFNLYWENLHMPAHIRQVASIIALMGTAGVEMVYEETDLPVIRPGTKIQRRKDRVTGEMVEEMVQDGEEVEFSEDIRAHVYNAFQLQPDPGATSAPNSMSWIRRTTFEDIDWIKEEFERDEEGYFPKHLDRLGAEGGGTLHTPLYWWERVKDLLDTPEWAYGITGYPYNSSGGYAPNQNLLHVYDTKPNRDFPRGRTLMFCGDVLIYAGDSRSWSERYPHRYHPYSFYRFWTVPGRFWGIPLIQMLVPLQRRINAIDALVQINREYMTLGQWLVPSACKVPEGVLSGLPGQQISYRLTPTGAKPERVDHVPLPGELLAERDLMTKQIDIIAGTNKVIEGENPSNVRAGVMLDFLKKETMKSKSAMLQNFEESTENVGQNLLIEVSLNVEEGSDLTQRIMAAARQHSQIAVQNFTGRSLRDNVNIRLDIISQILRSPEAMQQKAIEAAQFLQERMSDAQIAKLFQVIGLDELDIGASPHFDRANKMVSRVVGGMVEAAVPLPHDKPDIFIAVIEREMSGDKFIDYEQEVQNKLMELWDLYRQMQAQAQEQAFQTQVRQQWMMARAEKGDLAAAAGGGGGGTTQ